MGFISNIWKGFTGELAEERLKEGLTKGTAALGEGRNAATGAITASGQEARGYLQPYREQGGLANRAYGASLGLYGNDERKAVQKSYFDDDVLQQQLDLSLKRQGQRDNSNGYGGYGARGYGPWASGTAALAANRTMLGAWDAHRNRLDAAGQQGQQAATTTAGLAQNEGNAIAGIHTGYGQGLAELYGQHGRASAENAGTPFRNALGLVGAGLQGVGLYGKYAGWGNNLGNR
jgi:hypothetical protein